jgi:hypothetical protein
MALKQLTTRKRRLRKTSALRVTELLEDRQGRKVDSREIAEITCVFGGLRAELF